MSKIKKQRIELMTTTTGWERGFVSKILSQDDSHYYFNDVRDHWSTIEKSKEGIEFIIVGKNYPKAPPFTCGGKDVTYNKLLMRAAEFRQSQDEN